MRTTLSAITLLLLTSTAMAADNSFAITDTRVFDGDKTIDHADVVVKDGRIVSVGAHAAIPAGVTVIDGRGKTVIPGLIDSHVHVFPFAQADAVRFGVTTELDMFAFTPDFKSWDAQRESLAQTNQADTWSAGIGVTVPDGHPTELMKYMPPGSPMLPTLGANDDPKAFVDARVKEGSDYIKIILEDTSEYQRPTRMPTLTEAQLCGVIAEAHKDGKLTTTHVQQESRAREAIGCGTDGLAHLFPDVVADADFVKLAKSHHVFIQTTASVWTGVSGLHRAQDLANDPRVAPYLSPMQRGSLLMGDGSHVMPQFFPNVLKSLKLLHDAGVPLLAGTDAPNPGTAHGVALHEELQILVEAGFTPEAALNAATALPAKIFHLGDRGHVSPGHRADLMLIDGDPTAHIADTLSIDRIWKNGYAIDRTAPKADPRGPAPGGLAVP